MISSSDSGSELDEEEPDSESESESEDAGMEVDGMGLLPFVDLDATAILIVTRTDTCG